MANHVIRFYARSARPVWEFIDEAIPDSDMVRRSGRLYNRRDVPGGGWYLTVVVTTESAARRLHDWISARSDHSFEVTFWTDVDVSMAESRTIRLRRSVTR
jgi:hypothetical protein